MMELGFTWEEFFSIRTDIIWFYGNFRMKSNPNDLDQLCLKELGAFLMYGGEDHWKQFSVLWKTYKKFHGFSENDENPDYSQKSKIRDMAMDGFYFGRGLSYRVGSDGINEPIGVLLAQPIKVDFSDSKHKEFFYKLFPFRFLYLQPEYRSDFLDFHFKTTFKSDVASYLLFLTNVKASSSVIFGDYIDFINQYINSLKNRVVSSGSENRGAKAFKELFKSDAYYDAVIKELSQENPGKPKENSKKWFDTNGNFILKGKGVKNTDHPSSVGALLNALIKLGAIHSEIEKDIPTYAKTCFGIEKIGINNAKGNNKKYLPLYERLKRALGK